MTVRVASKLIHEAKHGDGIRAFVVTSASNMVRSTKVHLETADLNIDTLEVTKGDTIDFIVDIDKVLNSDQYLWTATIAEYSDGAIWDSAKDFPRNESKLLTGWEQLAQTLLCSNEFMFVD